MKKYNLELDKLDSLAKEIRKEFSNGVVILQGDLAAGKTTFVKAMAKELGYFEDVTSPTFSLQQRYGDKIFHYDVYNHGVEHFVSMGMLEELDKEGVHFVEWGDDKLISILQNAGMDFMTIEIKKTKNDAREYTVCIY